MKDSKVEVSSYNEDNLNKTPKEGKTDSQEEEGISTKGMEGEVEASSTNNDKEISSL